MSCWIGVAMASRSVRVDGGWIICRAASERSRKLTEIMFRIACLSWPFACRACPSPLRRSAACFVVLARFTPFKSGDWSRGSVDVEVVLLE